MPPSNEINELRFSGTPTPLTQSLGFLPGVSHKVDRCRPPPSSESNGFQLILIVSPAFNAEGHRAASKQGLLFDGRLQDEKRILLQRTYQPLLDACRVLLGEGADPKMRVVMRHAGSRADALITSVGAAAKLRVKEDDGLPRFTTWVPFPTRPDGSPVRFKGLPAVDLANLNENAPVTSPGVDDGAANEDQHHVDGDRDRPRLADCS
jgi:hypothetical protein